MVGVKSLGQLGGLPATPVSKAEGATMGRRGGSGQDGFLAVQRTGTPPGRWTGLIPLCMPSSKVVLDRYLNEHVSK